MTKITLGIDLASEDGDYTSFCVSRGTEILYLGTDPNEVRKYDVDVVITQEKLTVKKLKELLEKEKSHDPARSNRKNVER